MNATASEQEIAQTVRTPMTAEEIAFLNGWFELFCAGVIEQMVPTRCIEGAPGEGGASVPAVEMWVRDTVSNRAHIMTIPLYRAHGIEVGNPVRVYKTRRGWMNHIMTWHVLRALH